MKVWLFGGIMPRFVEIEQALYRKLTPLGDERTDFYRSDNRIARWLFWERLRQITKLMRQAKVRGRCLDLGGGSGVLLPTLAAHFDSVKCIDLDAELAKSIARRLELSNVNIDENDISDADSSKYSVIVAADVLEHFRDLFVPIDAIQRRLAPGGWLFTSLPTETWLYSAIRLVFRKKKPADHYHTAYEVEERLRMSGFKRVFHTAIPIPVLAPLFLISAWRIDGKP